MAAEVSEVLRGQPLLVGAQQCCAQLVRTSALFSMKIIFPQVQTTQIRKPRQYSSISSTAIPKPLIAKVNAVKRRESPAFFAFR
jgi:hypothetical protein